MAVNIQVHRTGAKHLRKRKAQGKGEFAVRTAFDDLVEFVKEESRIEPRLFEIWVDEIIRAIAGEYNGIQSKFENPGWTAGNGTIPVDKGIMRAHFTPRLDHVGVTYGNRRHIDAENLEAKFGVHTGAFQLRRKDGTFRKMRYLDYAKYMEDKYSFIGSIVQSPEMLAHLFNIALAKYEIEKPD